MDDVFAVRDPGDPAKWPIGARVVIPEYCDMHFFPRGATGTVSRHANHRVIVRLDKPIACTHGQYEHMIEEFNFNARDLTEAGTGKYAVRVE